MLCEKEHISIYFLRKFAFIKTILMQYLLHDLCAYIYMFPLSLREKLREAFQSKKQPNLGISPTRGGVVKKSKKSQVSVGKSSKLGGGLRKSKKSQVSEGTKD